MNPNRGITHVIIDYDSGNIGSNNDEEEVWINAWVSFLLFCKYNFNGKLFLYPYSYFRRASKPAFTVDLQNDIEHFKLISEKVSNFAIEEERDRYYGKFELVPDLYVLIDWHLNFFEIKRKERSCLHKMRAFFNTHQARRTES